MFFCDFRAQVHTAARFKEYSKVLLSSGTTSHRSYKTSIYSSMASLAIAMVSSTSSPYVIQPGRAGTVTVNPPSGSLCKSILYVYIIIFLAISPTTCVILSRVQNIFAIHPPPETMLMVILSPFFTVPTSFL